MSRKKRHSEEEHENHERWLVSYADFMTLLFAFFVVMYSVSRVDNKRLSQASQAIRWALHFSGTGGISQMPIFEGPPSEGGCSVNMGSGSASNQEQQKAIEMLRHRIEKRVRSFVIEKPSGPVAVTIHVEGRRIAVRLAASQFFDAGQAALRPQIIPILDAIADELVPLNRLLRVEGHTDTSPVAGTRFRDNWELSSARAAMVVSFLEQAHRARPDLLQAVGMGAAHPISNAKTAEASELNRRIEMVLELPAGDALLDPRSHL